MSAASAFQSTGVPEAGARPPPTFFVEELFAASSVLRYLRGLVRGPGFPERRVLSWLLTVRRGGG